MIVAVIDSGVANLTSVTAALDRLRVQWVITDNQDEIRCAQRVILPGVGSAASAMRNLTQKNLVTTIRSLTQPVLGICLGMQILFERSQEGGNTECLGVIPGTVKKLSVPDGVVLPHMGWNQLGIEQAFHPLVEGVLPSSFVYFVHSFAAEAGEATIACCDYGQRFAAIVARRNFMGCQFHPEKSGKTGAQILKNFVEGRL